MKQDYIAVAFCWTTLLTPIITIAASATSGTLGNARRSYYHSCATSPRGTVLTVPVIAKQRPHHHHHSSRREDGNAWEKHRAGCSMLLSSLSDRLDQGDMKTDFRERLVVVAEQAEHRLCASAVTSSSGDNTIITGLDLLWQTATTALILTTLGFAMAVATGSDTSLWNNFSVPRQVTFFTPSLGLSSAWRWLRPLFRMRRNLFSLPNHLVAWLIKTVVRRRDFVMKKGVKWVFSSITSTLTKMLVAETWRRVWGNFAHRFEKPIQSTLAESSTIRSESAGSEWWFQGHSFLATSIRRGMRKLLQSNVQKYLQASIIAFGGGVFSMISDYYLFSRAERADPF
jgi:hypothetical protein